MNQNGCTLPAGNPHFPDGATGVARERLGYGFAMLQMLFVLAIVIGLVAAPPASGRMLLVPLGGEGRDGLARLAVGTGARLVAPGPIGGSLVVEGQRGPLMAAMMPGHGLVLSASMGGCGEGVIW
jgi:hypothetical protein